MATDVTTETTTAESGSAWADLIEGLQILAKVQTSEISPLHCEHDTLHVLADPRRLSAAELDHLDGLGFHAADDPDEGFWSFRFGSA